MFQLNILQNQWIILALAAGAILVLLVALYAQAMGRARPARRPPEAPGDEGRTPVPKILVLIYALTVVFAIVFTLVLAIHPPNW